MRRGFTLIELMTTLVIVGVLAAVGIGQYREYVKRAKAAEAYTTIGSLQKAQVATFFDTKYFAPSHQFYSTADFGDNGGATRLPTPGTKAKLRVLSDSVFQQTPYLRSLSTVNSVIGSSNDYYYNYAIDGGFYNDSGTFCKLFEGAPGCNQGGHDGAHIGAAYYVGQNIALEGYFNTWVSPSELGIELLPREHFVKIEAVSMENQYNAQLLYSVLIAKNGEIFTRPIIQFSIPITQNASEGDTGGSVGGDSGTSGGDTGKDTGGSGEGKETDGSSGDGGGSSGSDTSSPIDPVL